MEREQGSQGSHAAHVHAEAIHDQVALRDLHALAVALRTTRIIREFPWPDTCSHLGC